MRDLVLYTLLSLDGVAEEPGDWVFELDDEGTQNLARVIRTQRDVLLGRGTYDYWSGYWPTADVQPFADFINATPKHLFTSSGVKEDWQNTVVADGSPKAYVDELKNTGEGDIGVHGSIRLAQSLLAEGLVDRLELVVVPTIAGRGRRLFENDQQLSRLTLERAERTPTGCVFLTYSRYDRAPS